MADGSPRPLVRIAGNPLHPLLAAVPSTCFVGTLITDIVYWQTAEMQWANFSAWLLAVGLFIAIFAIIVGMIDILADARIRALGMLWWYGLGNLVVLALEILNSFVHSRDAYSSVVPEGLILSVISVLILLATGWAGWELVYQRRFVVMEERP